MNITHISNNIFYVGVNDRYTVKFENLWPLPNGISYNSYLVMGSESVALVDAVEEGYLALYMDKIESVLAGRKIDYLIINHMEPDHSGAIPDIVRRYPDIKLVGNRMTMGMLQGYYGIDSSHFREVKDNDTISLGDKTFRFIMTPMVHWPETMMTYIPEDRVIFSGDAFGCYGALNGAVIDRDMNPSPYFDEMYRYYSNIVAKFGIFVQKALAKIKDFDLEYICTTHGPVWNACIKDVMDIYNRLSLYEGEQGVTIVYGSMYGNTEEVAEIIAAQLARRGVKNIRMHKAGKSEMSYILSDTFRYKGLIIGSPTYCVQLYPPIQEFMSAIENRELKNRVTAIFGSFTWASMACNILKQYTDRMQLNTVAELDFKQAPSQSAIEQAIQLADKVSDNL